MLLYTYSSKCYFLTNTAVSVPLHGSSKFYFLTNTAIPNILLQNWLKTRLVICNNGKLFTRPKGNIKAKVEVMKNYRIIVKKKCLFKTFSHSVYQRRTMN